VEVPLFDATFSAIGYRVGGDTLAGDPRALARMLGVTRQFESKDGRWFMYHAGNKNAPDFLAATGAEWLLPGEVDKLSMEELRDRTEALFKTRRCADASNRQGSSKAARRSLQPTLRSSPRGHPRTAEYTRHRQKLLVH
ncbi:MAG TPA: hypothetical protein PKD27_13620, partial [Tepidiformaceae bacterium]|nr:hypothetical protein [Tepidiformaceae bacterium]